MTDKVTKANPRLDSEMLTIFTGRSRPVSIDKYSLEVTTHSSNIDFKCEDMVFKNDRFKLYLTEKNEFIKYEITYDIPNTGNISCDTTPISIIINNIMEVVIHTENILNISGFVYMSLDTVMMYLPKEYCIIYLKETETYGGGGYYIVDTEFGCYGELYPPIKEQMQDQDTYRLQEENSKLQRLLNNIKN